MAPSSQLKLHGHDSIALFFPLLLPLLALLLGVLANVINSNRLLCLQQTQPFWVQTTVMLCKEKLDRQDLQEQLPA